MQRIKRILNIRTLILVFFEIALCYLILNYGTYNFGFPIEIKALYVISAFCAIYLGYNFNIITDDYKNNTRRILLTCIFTFLSAFAFLGNAIFLQRITYPINIKDFIEFAVVLIWFVPISLMILSSLENLYLYSKKSNTGFLNKNRRAAFGFLCYGIIMAAGIVYIIAFNPAITSFDTATQFKQALGISKLSNWHTPFHTLFLRYVVGLCDVLGIKGYSLTVIALLQCAFFAAVWSSGIMFLCEKGLNKALGVLFTVLIAFLPNNSIMLITIWKDIPYTASLLWLTIIFSKIMMDKEKYKVGIYIEITLCLTIIMLLRQNGIVIFILSIIALLFMLKFNFKILLSIVLSIAIIALFKGPVFKMLDVQDSLTENGKYVGLAADINSVYEAGGEVSDEAHEFLMDVKDTDRVTMPGYSPYYTDVDIPNDLEMDMARFLKMYLDTAFKNPLKMTKAILFRSDFIYDVVFPEDCYLSTSLFYGTVETDNNFKELWLENFNGRSENSLTIIFTDMIVKLREPIYSYFVRRAGIYNIISMALLFIFLIRKNYKGTLIYTVWIGQILSLLLSTAWQDYRYVWCFEILCFYFIAYFICKKNEDEETKLVD